MTKRIYFEPAGRMHAADEELLLYPPPGYEFVNLKPNTFGDKALEKAVTSDFFFFNLRRALEAVMPLNLTKAWLEGVFKKLPDDIDMTYAFNHPVFRKEPWVINVEWVHVLVGRNFRHFRRYKRLVERLLASSYCKRILTYSELGKKAMLLNLDCSKFDDKIEVIPLAVRHKEFVKRHNEDKVKILYVGTVYRTGAFEYKGGGEMLETFAQLSQKYDNLELVVRSDVPAYIKKKYQGLDNIKWIEQIISWELLEQEYKSADIFLYPTHDTPWRAILDAMSYELPVVTNDARYNAELVEDGVTGFVVAGTDKVPYWMGNLIPAGATPLRKKLVEAIRNVDPDVVERLVEKTSLLIENRELRRKMGKAARHEVEEGRFSIKRRNEKLKRIFDEATVKA